MILLICFLCLAYVCFRLRSVSWVWNIAIGALAVGFPMFVLGMLRDPAGRTAHGRYHRLLVLSSRFHQMATRWLDLVTFWVLRAFDAIEESILYPFVDGCFWILEILAWVPEYCARRFIPNLRVLPYAETVVRNWFQRACSSMTLLPLAVVRGCIKLIEPLTVKLGSVLQLLLAAEGWLLQFQPRQSPPAQADPSSDAAIREITPRDVENEEAQAAEIEALAQRAPRVYDMILLAVRVCCVVTCWMPMHTKQMQGSVPYFITILTKIHLKTFSSFSDLCVAVYWSIVTICSLCHLLGYLANVLRKERVVASFLQAVLAFVMDQTIALMSFASATARVTSAYYSLSLADASPNFWEMLALFTGPDLLLCLLSIVSLAMLLLKTGYDFG